MKKLQNIIAVTLVTIFALSCSKNDEVPITPAVVNPIIYNEENPFNAFIATMSNSGQVSNSIYGEVQWGYIFKCTERGKINSLMIKIPVINNALKVYMWDKATLALIKTEIVNVSAANVNIIKIVTPILLEKNKEYVITIFSDDYIVHSSPSGAVSYPVVAGTIQILGTLSGVDGACPTGIGNGSSNSYRGDVSFNFQRTE